MADIKATLINNYMPYAQGVIVARAIPAIDGLKPVHRKILYTMHQMNLYDRTSKCANIVGNTMALHPHGESSIYEALVKMTTGNDYLNLPYIKSKGDFGSVYSETSYAAMRYTEAKLDNIAKEMFDGINENGVDFKPNYDNTLKEPILLPVKFPSILVNTSAGIAVGMSSNIPTFGLQQVCNATIGILKGEINSTEKLMEILEAPEFSTGGFIHGDKGDYDELGKTGRGTVTLSSKVEVYQDKIVIKEIPYKATSEEIVRSIIEAIKSGELKEVSDATDDTGINGLKITVHIKRGHDVRKVLKKLNNLTNIKMKISFITRVIIDGRPVQLGLLDLLHEWIKFRMETIQKIYEYRLIKKQEQEMFLNTWEILSNSQNGVKDAVLIISNNKEEESRKLLTEKFRLNKKQLDYLMDIKIRELTTDRMLKKLKELNSLRKDMNIINNILSSKESKINIIMQELDEIKNKYGKPRRTTMAKRFVAEKSEKEEDVIDDVNVAVIVTRNGYIKRLISIRDETNLIVPEGDSILYRISCNNRDTLIVLNYEGIGYKIPVYSIETSKGTPKESISNLIGVNIEDVLFITNAEGYTKSVNIIGQHGRGIRLRLSKLSGPRDKYKNLYEEGDRSSLWACEEDKFFIITRNRKAAYADVSMMNYLMGRQAYKVARIDKDDEIFGIQPISKVPNPKIINLEKYCKGYCVKIKDDKLW